MENDNTTPETWRPVLGWAGLYEVSDHGNVRSVTRPIAYRDGRVKRHRGRTLSPAAGTGNRDGYLRVGLSRDGKLTTAKVHLLVATAFHGPKPPGAMCRHLNDVPTDNRAVNLAWGSGSDNQRDSVRNVRHGNTKKRQCLRGHELIAPNLTGERPGHRDCKACRAARKSLNRRFGGYTEEQARELSDRKYAEYMAA